MKVAIWQTASADMARLRERAREASALGARLLITPEAFASGYNVADIAELAQPEFGPWHEEVAAIATDAGIAILYGHPERVGEQVFNTATLLDRDGEVLARHHKVHLYGDADTVYTSGTTFESFAHLDGVRIGILICYDVEFPESVRALALAGADLVAVPTALMRPYEVVTRILVPARAYENQVYLAYTNRSGTEGSLTYCGESCIVGPDGTDRVRAGDGDELLVAEIDPEKLAASRADNTHLHDRRPELYDALTRKQR
ncbi:MAG TPA: carbon-nitrogen hydrolase family protein [Marmoricola sp.]|nr:carbon-nitrogen hydrolase family protein [Marmoricola sp.]